jgi:glutamyl-tRNA reductase
VSYAGSALEPTLIIIGMDHHSAPLVIRERFWIGEKHRYDALRKLRDAEGIEEAVILSTCQRTEFILWAGEPTLAANSVLQFLTLQYGLKLSDWEHFYRLLDESALAHIFRIACGLDSPPALCESEISSHLQAAWQQAQTVGSAGRFLNAILEKTLVVAEQIRDQPGSQTIAASIPQAVLALAQRLSGSLAGCSTLLLGTSKTAELAARNLLDQDATSICVIGQSFDEAQQLAAKLGAEAGHLNDRWQRIVAADVVISCSECPHVILSAAEAERIAVERNRRPLLIFDLGMPRDIDPDVHRVDGILLYDLDGIERFLKHNATERSPAIAEAEKIICAEARAFRARLQAENTIPTIVALRLRLEEICRQELDSFIEERGPFTREQDEALHALSAQLIRKIASSLARELKGVPEKQDLEQMTAALERLFHLQTPPTALAGTRSEKNSYEQPQQRAIALPH